jgi:allantoinase
MRRYWPYLMKVGDKRFYSIPYSAEINDKTAVEFHHVVPEEFDRIICRQFNELYREGAVGPGDGDRPAPLY